MNRQIASKRLKELRTEKGLSHKKLSEELLNNYNFSISDKQLMYIEAGANSFHSRVNAVEGMATKTLYTLAQFYNVSTDYILGFTDVKSTIDDVKSTCYYTGLYEETVETLRCLGLHQNRIKSHIINFILQDTNLINAMIDYFQYPFLSLFASSDYFYLHRCKSMDDLEYAKKGNYADLIGILAQSMGQLQDDIKIDKNNIAVAVAKEYIDAVVALRHLNDEKNNISEEEYNYKKILIHEVSKQQVEREEDRFQYSDYISNIQQIFHDSLRDITNNTKTE